MRYKIASFNNIIIVNLLSRFNIAIFNTISDCVFWINNSFHSITDLNKPENRKVILENV